ncbi:MAG: AraC family transcriptional regulator [Clostridia bacterium]|nr:AraC family transcriptional regulator [Clostridia bacterium]
MPNYRTTELPEGIRVSRIMSFFTTCFDCATLVKNRRETYPFWAMIYTVKGDVTFQIGEEQYRVRAGELIFYPASVPHSIDNTEEKSWEVSFATFACDSVQMQSLVGRVFVPDAGIAERIRSLFRFGGKCFYNLPTRGDDTVGMFCRADELELMRIKSELEAVLTRLCLSLNQKRAERRNAAFAIAVEYMKAHLGRQITLSQLAGEVGVSVSTLKKAFQKESGGGVNSYYIDLKLSNAAKLLCESDLSVGEIADRLGFSSQFYFSELFKKRYGQSPSLYRKQQEAAWRELL